MRLSNYFAGCLLLALACVVGGDLYAQTVSFSGHDASGRPQSIQIDSDVKLLVTYTPKGAVASVTDGQATVRVEREPTGRLRKVIANGWLIISFEYESVSRVKRVYDNFGNELSFVKSAAGVREDVYKHANRTKLSADYLKTVDPIVLKGLAGEPAAFALAIYSLAFVERADLALFAPGAIRHASSWFAENSLLISLVEAIIPSAHAASLPICPPKTYLALRGWVEVACKVGGPSVCLPGDTCFVNTLKIARRSNCINARKTIMRRCFNGGGAGHQQQVEQEINGIKECMRVRATCCRDEDNE